MQSTCINFPLVFYCSRSCICAFRTSTNTRPVVESIQIDIVIGLCVYLYELEELAELIYTFVRTRVI
jgi:hypothetical protein